MDIRNPEKPLSGLKTAVLLLDREKCSKNIAFMAEKAVKHNLALRPHFKTHQSLDIARWFRKAGTTRVTVSSIGMAAYFAGDGWDDICVAFPFNIHEMEDAGALAKKIKLHLTVCSAETTGFIEQSSVTGMGIYIKTDTGYHRTGVSYDDTAEIDEILRIIGRSKKLHFSGFLVHNGQTYQAGSHERIEEIHAESVTRLAGLKRRYKSRFPDLLLSSGDTPSCSISENFGELDEIRPGNYVFYDLSQCHTGSCNPAQVAVALAAPVVAKHKKRNEIVVYGGAVHLSKEDLRLEDGRRVWGQVAEPDTGGKWGVPVTNAYVTKVSQEHGIIKCDDRFFRETETGDFLYILPVHSCLTANLMRGYITTDGEIIDHLSGLKCR